MKTRAKPFRLEQAAARMDDAAADLEAAAYKLAGTPLGNDQRYARRMLLQRAREYTRQVRLLARVGA